MRIPPEFFSDDAQSQFNLTESSASRFSESTPTDVEETLQLPGLVPTPAVPEMASIRLGEILEPLKEAIRSDSTFLDDFADDQVQIPNDLLECLSAYGHMQRAA